MNMNVLSRASLTISDLRDLVTRTRPGRGTAKAEPPYHKHYLLVSISSLAVSGQPIPLPIAFIIASY